MKKLFLLSIACIMSLSSCSSVGKSEISSEQCENNEDIVIHIATAWAPKNFTDVVKEFNNEQNGYKIEVVDYAPKETNEFTGSLKLDDFSLIHDFLSNSEIDAVSSFAFSSEINYRFLIDNGGFTNLYQFMENDPDINKNTLNSHILSINETDGELYTLPSFYTAHTLCGAPEYVGTKVNWSFDDLYAQWRKMPDNATIMGGRSKENAFYQLLQPNLENFVDYKAQKVNFDSVDFRKALEFCNEFDYADMEKTDLDFNTPQFCSDCTIFNYMSVQTFKLGSNNPKITFVGFPSTDGNGAFLRAWGECFSISKASSEEKQKGAWEFIRKFFTEEWQTENALSYSDKTKGCATQNAFCMNIKANENIKQNVVAKKYSPETAESKGETYTVEFPTIDDCNALDEYLMSISRWEVDIDESLRDIAREEIMRYFADEISIDECTENIQSRANLWINEK